MARRRMFNLDIIDTDLFIEMPQSSRLLYYELCMRADDDGFVSSPKKIQRVVGCSDDDFKVLITKKFIIPFETGVVVIRHWKIHNYIQKDRYKETLYSEEKRLLSQEENGAYKLMDTSCIQNGDTGKDSIELVKDSIELVKDSIDNNIKENIKEIEVSHSAKAEQCDIPYEDIISYLNFKAGTNFRSNTNKTKSLIKARFKEGFTVEEFKVVIDKKCIEWLNNKDMSKYLRPETLFGTKFEGYLNQKTTTKKETKSNKQLEFLKGVYNGTIKID